MVESLKDKIPEGPEFNSTDQERQLIALLDQSTSNLDDIRLKALLEKYTVTLDWDTQERIENILSEVDKEMWVRIVLEEMPRLLSDAPEWAVSLLGEEIEHRFQMVQESLSIMPLEVQHAVESVLKSDDFRSFYSNAESLFK